MPAARRAILHLTHQGDGAGSTQSLFGLAVHQARHGHRVLVGCRPESLLAGMIDSAGLPRVALDFRRLPEVATTLDHVMTRERIDLVNSHASRDRRALAWLRLRGRLPQAFVVTRRTMPLTSPLEQAAIGWIADRTIAVSRAVGRALVRRGQPAGRVRVVPNGIDLARVDVEPDTLELEAARASLGETRGRPVVVVLARRKDQHVLVAGLKHLERPVVVALVGITPDAELRAELSSTPARHAVVTIPFTERVLAYYRLAAIAALPSRIEGLSQALLEAMALGVPVIASNASGNPDLIEHERTGLLVAPLDPIAWARVLERLLADPPFAAALARAGREHVRREHTIETTAERTEEVYEEVLKHRNGRGPGSAERSQPDESHVLSST